MKILHVIQTLDVRHGGPVTVLRGLTSAQVAAGHRVTVYTTWRDIDSPKRNPLQQENGVTLCYFPGASSLMLFSPALYRGFRNGIRDFDIVHIHGLYRFPMTYAAWRARKARVPYIIRPHGTLDPFLYRQSRYGKWALPLKRCYESLFDLPNLNHASAIHYTSKEEMERTAFLKLRAPAVIIPNGIDWQQYALLPQSGVFRQRIRLGSQTPLLLFLGRINFKKGLNLLVPSFASVLEKVPDARLAIVGPDNEGYLAKVHQWCLEQGIEDKVIFVDHLGPEEVKQAYVDADVFVLPSYTENFGMTVVEAMACGCPVVISDQVNIWREVKDAGAGIVTTLAPSEIAEAILRILRNTALGAEMGMRGRVAAKERYSWPKIVQSLTEIYRDIIVKAARTRRDRG